MSKKDKNIEVQPPKRARRAIKKLHTLVEFLEYYTGGRKNTFFRETIVKELAQDIEEVLHELSIESKIDHIRLATKLKTIWKKEVENTIDERVEEEVENRIGNIIEKINREDRQ